MLWHLAERRGKRPFKAIEFLARYQASLWDRIGAGAGSAWPSAGLDNFASGVLSSPAGQTMLKVAKKGIIKKAPGLIWNDFNMRQGGAETDG